MTISYDHAAMVDVTAVDGTDWHLQLSHAGLHLKAGAHYTASFTASADRTMKIVAGVSQAHAPWESDGLSAVIQLDPKQTACNFAFTVTQSDDNARLGFILGGQTGHIVLGDVKLTPGGIIGLTANEDPAQGTVKSPSPQLAADSARSQDWYSFLQQTEENITSA